MRLSAAAPVRWRSRTPQLSPVMKRIPLSLLFATLLAAPLAGLAQEPPAAQPSATSAPTLFVDLRGETTPAYPYESWTEAVRRTPDGALVVGSKGARGDGGFCGNLNPAADLSGVAYVEVALAVGLNNEVPEVTIGAGDADETMATARIRIDQIVPGHAVWFRVPLGAFQLGSGKYAGKVAGMDWTKVAQWHLQGDWATKKPLQVLFIAIRARR